MLLSSREAIDLHFNHLLDIGWDDGVNVCGLGKELPLSVFLTQDLKRINRDRALGSRAYFGIGTSPTSFGTL